jgi:LysM repeat protein
MTAGRSDRRLVKIRRRGRHTTPSQVEKVAQQAGKAAPAVAIAGALVAVPQAQHALASVDKPVTATAEGHHATAGSIARETTRATLDSIATQDMIATRAVVVASTSSARHAAVTASTHYTVRSGDTLSAIAQERYHKAADWQYLYHENDKTISDPNMIYVGETLFVPATAPAHYTLPSSYVPRHAAPVVTTATTGSAAGDTDASGTSGGSGSGSSTGNGGGTATIGGASDGGTVVVQSGSQGSYGCTSLEQLWDEAGGNPADAFMAAEIAMAESGGNPNAISPTDDYGLWQINASNGALATLDPLANAKSAVILSNDGTNWSPWTTYTSGAYSGRC